MRSGTAFRLGINYWPARTAMGWWPAFEVSEVAADFNRIATNGFDSVRIFLTWEDFQPTPSRVDTTMVARLVSTLDEACRAGLSVMPTLFTGHMSGVNWIPGWALGNEAGDERFRVVSGGRVVASHIANWYTDASIVRAQSELACELAGALSGHEALWAWDLGNENSNCSIPPDDDHARDWLLHITDSIRGVDPKAQITIGLHVEDLEQDRKLGPRQAGDICNFLEMHGYPGYATWTDGPTDERALPFLALLTTWLSGGADVLFGEFGVPTTIEGNLDRVGIGNLDGVVRINEQAAASYIDRALVALHECGSKGAMVWCYSDYAEAILGLPPLDRAIHERTFGLWHADTTPKPAVAVVKAFAKKGATVARSPGTSDLTWIDIDAAEYYRAPAHHLPRLYRRYSQTVSAQSRPPRINGQR